MGKLNPFIKKGTIIMFDELCDFTADKQFKTWKEHEWKATHEWMEKYNRDIKVLGRNDDFRVLTVVTK